MTRAPVAPIPVAGGAPHATERLPSHPAPVPRSLLDRIRRGGGSVSTDPGARAEAGRDWWPLAIGWAVHGQVPARPAAVVRPRDAAQVADILAACAAARVPVTPAGGRSGVCGGAVPLFGGITLDLTALDGDVALDEVSLVAEVPAGVFGADLEAALRAEGAGYTLGHWPQSVHLSTVGGWLACRSAGQYSTRYGKIEDMVVGLEVALADGSLVRTGAQAPRAATGPDLTQLFCGSEGVLGVITRAWLRVHPVPAGEGRRAYGFASFADGLAACRRILRRGATPAVLRLYDAAESARTLLTGPAPAEGTGAEGTCALVVLDEADPPLLDATLGVVDAECAAARRLPDEVVERWWQHRYDVSALAPLWAGGVVVDTAEVAARWAALGAIAGELTRALEGLDGTLAASVHQSHAYLDGACLYFTFAGAQPGGSGGRAGGTPPGAADHGGGAPRPGDGALAWQEAYYLAAWDALEEVVERHGGAISHHHGIGLSRGRFAPRALGPAHAVVATLKRALDPAGILNPGKLGLASAFGQVPWP